MTFPRRIQLVPQRQGLQRGTEAREEMRGRRGHLGKEASLVVSTHQGYIGTQRWIQRSPPYKTSSGAPLGTLNTWLEPS